MGLYQPLSAEEISQVIGPTRFVIYVVTGMHQL
jgi:hypothetical protein